MGEIMSSKKHNDEEKVVVELLLDYEEYRQLKGEMDDIYVFSDKTARTPSRVSLRGRNEATKYFLIPRQLRKQLAVNGEVSCQRIDSDGKLIFIYVLDPVKEGRTARLAM